MKKVIIFLAILALAVVLISIDVTVASDASIEETEAQIMPTASPEPTETEMPAVLLKSVKMDEAPMGVPSENYPPLSDFEPPQEPESTLEPEDTPEAEQTRFFDDVPLSYEEQELLQNACKEFDVPYALALGLIQAESNFRNIFGDDGASAGYMQIQQRWHAARMERLGVTDLTDPDGNFRVGLDLMNELYTKYGDWGVALTVYNKGHDPGYISDYANTVLGNCARWQELVRQS